MAKRCHELDSDVATTETAEYNTVFVDTSLDTHLAMLVSKSDRVSDFRKKIQLEHMQCFPKVGGLEIQSLKVKRRSNFYHLPDIMLVWSAFQGVKGSWFLSADVSCTLTCHLNQISSELGTNEGVNIKDADDCRGLSSDVNRMEARPVVLPDDVCEKNEVSEKAAGLKFEKSLEKTTDFQRDTYSGENCLETEFHAKKKRKMKHTVDVCHTPSLRESCVLLNPSSSVRNDQSNSEAPAENIKLESITNSQNLLDSNKRREDMVLEGIIPENFMACKPAHEVGHDVATESLRGVSNEVPDFSTGLMDAGGAMEDVNSDANKRKKKKANKTAAKIQDKTPVEQTSKYESTKLCTETHKSEKEEEEKGLSLNHDHELTIPSNKVSDNDDLDLVQKESFLPNLVDAHAVMEPEVSCSSKKKRKKKMKREEKSAYTNLEKPGIKQIVNGISGSSGLISSSTDHITKESDEEESTLCHKRQDVQMKLLHSSNNEASEKNQGGSGNEADFTILTQTNQILEDVATERKIIGSGTGSCHEDLPAVELEDQFVELSQGEENIKNTVNKDKKPKKKRKKVQHSASDVQENLPVSLQEVDVEVLTTEENLINPARSEKEGKHVASSSVLSISEEKVDEINGAAVNAGDMINTSKNEGEGINFKQYFLPGQYQDKVDSCNEEKKATITNARKTRKKVKVNGLPSVHISTELQNSVESSENQESEHKSCVRNASGRRQGDSEAQNSDRDEVFPNSSRTSLRDSGIEAKGSSPGEMWDMKTIGKTNEIVAASPCPKEQNMSLRKSISERSETFPEDSENKRLQSGLNVTKKMAVNTPKKKSLLTKSGAIFQDNSGGSSGGENVTVHSDASTRGPSDSSSLSSYTESVGESDLSQDSTRNGSNDAKDRSGGKNTSKLDLSASKDMTMDMILRSSKRFKKFKVLVSQNELEQNESQQTEFVPDSQPI